MRHLPVLAVLAACSTAAPAPTPELRARAEARASAAIDELQATLGRRLQETMQAGGPQAAAAVCSAEAQALTQSIAERTRVAVGRTSDRLRNPASAPRAWVRPWLEANAGKKAAETGPASVDLGDRVGTIRPIEVKAMCLACHGVEIAPEVQALIDARYPADAARGYAEGDLRGAFWAEAPID